MPLSIHVQSTDWTHIEVKGEDSLHKGVLGRPWDVYHIHAPPTPTRTRTHTYVNCNTANVLKKKQIQRWKHFDQEHWALCRTGDSDVDINIEGLCKLMWSQAPSLAELLHSMFRALGSNFSVAKKGCWATHSAYTRCPLLSVSEGHKLLTLFLRGNVTKLPRLCTS